MKRVLLLFLDDLLPMNTFDVHGSVHLGNTYVQLKVQLDVLFYVFFILLYS
jgi:hypothetical protein